MNAMMNELSGVPTIPHLHLTPADIEARRNDDADVMCEVERAAAQATTEELEAYGAAQLNHEKQCLPRESFQRWKHLEEVFARVAAAGFGKHGFEVKTDVPDEE